MMQEGVPPRCASCEREHGASARERIESRVEARLARLRSEGAAPSMASSSSPRPPPPATRGTGSDDRGEDPKIVWMNCDRDGSLTEAIAHAEAGPLVVHVVGTCRESVRVARADVTIAGDASGAVIRPPRVAGKPVGPGLFARGAHGLALQDLTVHEATDGIVIVGSRGVTLTRVTSKLNNGPSAYFGGFEGFGAVFDGSEAAITASNLSENQAPMVAYRESSVTVDATIMNDNNLDGPFSSELSSLTVRRSDMSRNAFCPQAVVDSRMVVIDSTVSCDQESFAIKHAATASAHSYLRAQFFR